LKLSKMKLVLSMLIAVSSTHIYSQEKIEAITDDEAKVIIKMLSKKLEARDRYQIEDILNADKPISEADFQKKIEILKKLIKATEKGGGNII
jgi:hypothetical protein